MEKVCWPHLPRNLEFYRINSTSVSSPQLKKPHLTITVKSLNDSIKKEKENQLKACFHKHK